jgi:hypothetical protein
MVILGKNNQKFDMKILNYEVPPTAFGYNKDLATDWIEVEINIESNFGVYNQITSFEIYEIENLIFWLRELSKNKQCEKTWEKTIEDYFVFELLNSYNANEKNIKIIFRERQKYLEFVADNKLLYTYSKQLSSELRFLLKTYKLVKVLYKIIQTGIKSIKRGKIIEELHTVKIKNNFKEGYRDETGYKIVYSKCFIKDQLFLNYYERDSNLVDMIYNQVEKIKKCPFENTDRWDNYFLTYAIRFKIINKYTIFYRAYRYESIEFIRIIKNTKYFNKYLEYIYRDLSIEK